MESCNGYTLKQKRKGYSPPRSDKNSSTSLFMAPVSGAKGIKIFQFKLTIYLAVYEQ